MSDLVGGIPTPLKNMSSSVGMMTFPTEWKVIKHVPNHQPVMDVFGMVESPLNVYIYIYMYIYICICIYIYVYIYINRAYGSKMSMFLFANGPTSLSTGRRGLPSVFFQLDHLGWGSHV